MGIADGSAAPGLVGLTATHEITAPVQPTDLLPGARIDRSSGGALDDVWGEGGELGVWLGPAREDGAAQFDPELTFVENLYFENAVDEDGLPLQPGDRAELALGLVPLDARQPWDRPRGPAGGAPGWDTTVVPTQATATYHGTSGALDVVLFRADVVIRDGDVDARSAVVEVAATSQRMDLVHKPPRYAAAGVPLYVVLDLADEVAVVHRDPSADGYAHIIRVPVDGTVELLDVTVDLAELFDRAR